MDNNRLLMIVLAFVVGYMASGMMKQMCGRRLFEGEGLGDYLGSLGVILDEDIKIAKILVPEDIAKAESAVESAVESAAESTIPHYKQFHNILT